MPTNVQVPALGESVTEAVLVKWHKNDGEAVKQDDPLAELETDKANVDVPAPAAGVIKRSVQEGTKVRIGETIATIDADAKASSHGKSAAAAKPLAKPERTPPSPPARASSVAVAAPDNAKVDSLSPAVRRMVVENRLDPNSIRASGPGGRLTKEDVVNYLDRRQGNTAAATAETEDETGAEDVDVGEATSVIAQTHPGPQPSEDGTRRATMSKIRKRIAERLVSAQQTAAILTTFNEVDLTEVIELRTRYKEKFEKSHGVGLGFMSFFVKAVTLALKEFEKINASIDGDDIVYHDYVHMGIAVSTDRGLAVPVLRHVEKMSYAKIESEIKRLAAATREGKLSLQELSGGTFTITNGGVFGSLLSTPILNPPQSAILGMHTIQKRPMVINDQITIRPMMYLALSYDHRLIDGRESVSFLVRVKELLEDPARLLLEV